MTNILLSPDLSSKNRADTQTLGTFGETYSSEAIILQSIQVNRQLRESKWIALIFTILSNSTNRIWQSMLTTNECMRNVRRTDRIGISFIQFQVYV